MAIICARRYSGGSVQDDDIAVDGMPPAALPEDAFDWVGLAEPTAEEMDRVSRQYGLHPLAVEDALTPAQTPKVDVYEQHSFIIARTAEFEGDGTTRLAFGQTAIFVGRSFIVTVRFGSARAHSDLRRKLEKDPEHLAQGADYVAHAVLDFIVDGYAPIVERVEETVEHFSEEMIAAFPDGGTIRQIFDLRRQLRRLNYTVGPMEEVCWKLANEDLPAIDRGTHIWFRDVYDHVRRTMAHLHGLAEALANIVETSGLLEQQRQGEITRQLAAWAAILAVPTAIAGIYGMNFRFMPELTWRYGYFLVVGAMATVCTALWFRFRRIGWL
ncbi:MAG: magnesium and cobalt transport protein CorA [Novosphingobium sp.]